MIRTRQSHRAAVAAALLVTAGLAGCITVPSGRTESTTVRLDYNAAALSTSEAEAQARARCGAAEVTKVSAPSPLPSGLTRITATCLASYDRSGNLTAND